MHPVIFTQKAYHAFPQHTGMHFCLPRDGQLSIAWMTQKAFTRIKNVDEEIVSLEAWLHCTHTQL